MQDHLHPLILFLHFFSHLTSGRVLMLSFFFLLVCPFTYPTSPMDFTRTGKVKACAMPKVGEKDKMTKKTMTKKRGEVEEEWQERGEPLRLVVG